MKVLVAVDIQNDFVSGSLGTKEAIRALANMAEIIADPQYDRVFATRDTHGEDYLATLEGKYLPIVHCIKNTGGWQFPENIKELLQKRRAKIFEKNTFGSVELASYLLQIEPDEIVLIGICTDICVSTNALLIRSYLPNTRIRVIGNACAATTVQKHQEALSIMASCQIEIENEEK